MIDYMKATMGDVIARSYAMHPSLLADCLSDAADIHRNAATAMRFDRTAARIAGEMAATADSVVLLINEGQMDAYKLNFSARIMAFGCAAKLLLVPLTVAHDIAKRG